MKSILKPITGILLLLSILFSCSQDEILDTESNLELNSNLELKSNINQYNEIKIILKSTKSLKELSEQLTFLNIQNKDTKEDGVFVTLKSSDYAKITATFGHFYDGHDCWIAGTWYHDDVTGASFFVQGSAATQYLNNVCGWSNVAKQK